MSAGSDEQFSKWIPRFTSLRTRLVAATVFLSSCPLTVLSLIPFSSFASKLRSVPAKMRSG